MYDYSMTNIAIRKDLGAQLRQMRINAQMNQQNLSERTGLSRSTITAIENGSGGTIESLVIILRELQKLNVLDAFATAAPISPLAVAKAKGRIPKRVFEKDTANNTNNAIVDEW